MDETIIAIKGLGEELQEPMIFKKVIRSLSPRYEAKVFAIEEARNLNKFSMDDLFGSLTTYEMRNVNKEASKREDDLKAFKKGEGWRI